MTSRFVSQGGKFLRGYCAFLIRAKMTRATDSDDDTTQYLHHLCIRLFAAEKEQLVLVRGN